MRERRGREAAQEKEARDVLVPAVLHDTGMMKQGSKDGRVGEKSRRRRKWTRDGGRKRGRDKVRGGGRRDRKSLTGRSNKKSTSGYW